MGVGREWEQGGTRLDRRVFLKGTAAVVGAAALGGIPGILRAGQAPAYPKGTKLHLLTRLNFFPAADKIFLAQAEEFGKQMGVEVQVERIGQNDIVTRTTAAIVAQSGADIIILHNNFPHLVADGLADVSDVADEIGKQQGGYYDLFHADAYVGTRWLGVPHVALSTAMNYREDWLREAGYSKFPDTWEELRVVGKKLKSMGHPVGQAFGHSENDPNTYSYSLLWSYGGMEVEADGKTVVLDKKGTLEAIKLNTALWKDAMDEGGLSWDDSSNNRAFLAGSLSVTTNGASIYFQARDKFPDLYKVMNHAPHPRGPAGRFYHLPVHSSSLMKYSKNQKLAKEFIRYYMAKEQYEKWFDVMGGYGLMPTKMWYDSPVWTRDPKLTPLREPIKEARAPGYAGPPSRKASEALTKYIIVDMFAKAIQGASPEEALKWATGELNKIYGA
ncbi:MAG TPA: extracellular solute-binding protein [Candidatus Methylomirabilis sp.]|nr:extracellular solute-binding protein [Candidatus Methylomirabilis sp.]HSC71486.1 extracellular solute-binding protein [Candidatus Methylomirabilis sp.]